MKQPLETTIQVKVLPRASRNEVVGKADNTYKIKLTAPPLEGKANKALIQLMGKKLGLPKRDVQIIAGARSRLKSLSIRGLSAKTVERLLSDN